MKNWKEVKEETGQVDSISIMNKIKNTPALLLWKIFGHRYLHHIVDNSANITIYNLPPQRILNGQPNHKKCARTSSIDK